MGPDLVWRSGRWIADPGRSHDSVVRGDSADFDRLIRHTYKVLLTRGLIGLPDVFNRRRDARVPPHVGQRRVERVSF